MEQMNKLAELLHSFGQGASNSIASGVSAPVDGIAWLLRKAGVPVPSAPLGGSDWMSEQGLTQEPRNKLAGLLGEVAGGVGPGLLAAKAPQVANGLLKMADNAAAPRKANPQLGGVLNPFPGHNYRTDDLSQYTSNVFRETNIDGASEFSRTAGGHPVDLWFANQPEYALGQGANKGVLMELDAKNLPGQLSLSKPNARQAYDSGYAEFVTRDLHPSELVDSVRSIVIKPEQQRGPYFRRLLNEYRAMGFKAETLADKSVRLSK